MTEDMKQELREEAEAGKRYQIAMEVWREFLDNQREALIKEIETGKCDDLALRDIQAKLHVMSVFRDVSYSKIRYGKMADETLAVAEGELANG